MRSPDHGEARESGRKGAEHQRAALEEGRYENRVPYREGNDAGSEVGGLVEEAELVSESVEGGAGDGDGEWGNAFGRAEPVKQYPRAPKGSKRSHERIREDICEELMHASDLDASEVEVAVREGVVVLAGKVPERSMKVRIEQIADRCAGGVEISNQIRVEQ